MGGEGKQIKPDRLRSLSDWCIGRSELWTAISAIGIILIILIEIVAIIEETDIQPLSFPVLDETAVELELTHVGILCLNF